VRAQIKRQNKNSGAEAAGHQAGRKMEAEWTWSGMVEVPAEWGEASGGIERQGGSRGLAVEAMQWRRSAAVCTPMGEVEKMATWVEVL
jgi:hypothetical protein